MRLGVFGSMFLVPSLSYVSRSGLIFREGCLICQATHESPEILLKDGLRLAGPAVRDGVCLSNKLPGDAGAYANVQNQATRSQSPFQLCDTNYPMESESSLIKSSAKYQLSLDLLLIMD